jgi:hypothetical protein
MTPAEKYEQAVRGARELIEALEAAKAGRGRRSAFLAPAVLGFLNDVARWCVVQKGFNPHVDRWNFNDLIKACSEYCEMMADQVEKREKN